MRTQSVGFYPRQSRRRYLDIVILCWFISGLAQKGNILYKVICRVVAIEPECAWICPSTPQAKIPPSPANVRADYSLITFDNSPLKDRSQLVAGNVLFADLMILAHSSYKLIKAWSGRKTDKEKLFMYPARILGFNHSEKRICKVSFEYRDKTYNPNFNPIIVEARSLADRPAGMGVPTDHKNVMITREEWAEVQAEAARKREPVKCLIIAMRVNNRDKFPGAGNFEQWNVQKIYVGKRLAEVQNN